MAKSGRLSKHEREWIRSNLDRMTPKEIAEKLGRTEDHIHRWVRENITPETPRPAADTENAAEKVIIKQELRNSQFWKTLKEEFGPDELCYFEEGYVKLMSQFRDDVIPSEETQIFQAIKIEILMHRNLVARKKALDDIIEYERELAGIDKQYENRIDMDQQERANVLKLESILNAARKAETDKTVEYGRLQERHEGLMESLKGTRAQRIKQIESGKVSFLGLIKALQQKDIAAREGREMELMRLATNKEYDRLGQLHEYEDGSVDRPILSPETVAGGDDE